MKKRTMTLVISLLLVALVAVGGTLAWLADTAGPVTNTFTVGNVDITLDEAKVGTDGKIIDVDDRGTGNSYEMIPGNVYDKDPKVTVKGGSEACYLYIEYIPEGNPQDYLDFTLNTADWTPLSDVANVWYKEVAASETDQSWNLLVGDRITVNATKVTKDNVADAAKAKISFNAYAIQSANIASAADGWTKLGK